MSNLGFDNYVEPLKLYLQKYREVILSLLLILIKYIFVHNFEIFKGYKRRQINWN